MIGRVETRVELKYCERCGALWVREGGGGVYCRKCEMKVAELPAPKKKPGRIRIPERRPTVLEGCGEVEVGGVA